jgi:hypothetical protein
MLPSARITWRVNMRIICRHAKPSNARATSRDAEGALDCGYCA